MSMVVTPAYAALTPTQWDDKFFQEYVRQSKYTRYMGTDEGAMFQVKEDLTKKPGDKISFAKVGKLTGAGVIGNAVLEGNEEVLDQHAMFIQADNFRHGVAVTDWDEQKSVIELRDIARGALKTWEMEKLKTDVTAALLQCALANNADGVPTPVSFGAANATQRNAWLPLNTDRVLVGNAKANYNATFATAMANIDVVNDILTISVLSLAKRIAQTASPIIRPIRTVDDDEEWYVFWAHPLAFRDLQLDANLRNYQAQALPRAKDNILFTGGDLLWDGIIVKELWELSSTTLGTLTGMGAGAIDVGVNVLAGAQAVGLAWARRLKTTTNDRDYNFRHGVGIQEARGIQKLQFGRRGTGNDTVPCDNGTVTVFTAAVADG